MKKETITLTITQTNTETELVQRIIKQVMNLPAVMVGMIFSLACTFFFIFFDSNNTYSSPLLFLSGSISIIMISVTVYISKIRPLLLRAITNNENKTIEMTLNTENFKITYLENSDTSNKLYKYADVAAQLWAEDTYILIIANSAEKNVISIKLTNDNFDPIYMLASFLESKKKRLRHIRMHTR